MLFYKHKSELTEVKHPKDQYLYATDPKDTNSPKQQSYTNNSMPKILLKWLIGIFLHNPTVSNPTQTTSKTS